MSGIENRLIGNSVILNDSCIISRWFRFYYQQRSISANLFDKRISCKFFAEADFTMNITASHFFIAVAFYSIYFFLISLMLLRMPVSLKANIIDLSKNFIDAFKSI